MCAQQRLKPACAYAQADQSFGWSLEYSKTLKLLTEQTLEFLSLTRGYTGSSESTLVKMPHFGNHMSRLISWYFKSLSDRSFRSNLISVYTICSCQSIEILSVCFCLIWFFTSHQQSFSYVGTGLPRLNQY